MNKLIKFGMIVISTIICWLPTEIFIWFYNSLGAMTILEKLATIGVGAFIGGGFQIFLFILWIWLIVAIIGF